MAYEPKKFTPAELAELHALPDEALLTAQEASAFLRLKYNTLSWYATSHSLIDAGSADVVARRGGHCPSVHSRPRTSST